MGMGESSVEFEAGLKDPGVPVQLGTGNQWFLSLENHLKGKLSHCNEGGRGIERPQQGKR